MFLRLRLELAHYLDLWESRLRRLAERWGWPQAWLAEFIAYTGKPRMTLEEFWVRFTLIRMDAEEHWLKPKMTEEEARKFYCEHPYMLWRNLVHRRHSAWRRVLVTMPKRGTLLEFGCGIAPVTAWVTQRRPDGCYDLMDIIGPAREYAHWRVGKWPHGSGECDVITALDVFEHLADPLAQAKYLTELVRPGGYLHWTLRYNELRNDLDLATREQLQATQDYLESKLIIVWRKDAYVVGQRMVVGPNDLTR